MIIASPLCPKCRERSAGCRFQILHCGCNVCASECSGMPEKTMWRQVAQATGACAAIDGDDGWLDLWLLVVAHSRPEALLDGTDENKELIRA